ncbi:hypothetical protein [Alkalicoccus daliensis]|uniref:Uncharacterized protein n=1 Tax=Alkalicoccus daliensis TaxID=745820 RepID=A0A1H0DWL9_9BACI|nr:hypothetical protein [Alkalicoccus daliensis]SDN74552.1 hypothetical protein SAMN04488053_103114 [Alkalicoccus daliensis]
MKSLFLTFFTKLYGPVPENSSLRLYYWITAGIFFVPLFLSPFFFISYFLQGGPEYAFTYGLLMLAVVWIFMPIFFRLIMRMNRFLYKSTEDNVDKRKDK